MSPTEQLIDVLLDPQARPDERDDAAIDLGRYAEASSLNALVSVANDKEAPEIVRASCGESIAEIWLSTDCFDKQTFGTLSGVALAEATAVIEAKAPHWLT